MASRRLKKDGLAQVQKNGRIRLTAAGRQIARKLALRHHLIEHMLSEIFGMEWYKVHDEAERLEHAVSPDFEAKLLSKLGPSGPCPHGNQTTPDKAASRKQRGLVLLREAETGSVYMIGSVYERDRKLLEFLEDVESGPDPKFKIKSHNCDQTLSLLTERGTFAVRQPVAKRVWVVPAGKPSCKSHSHL